MKYSLGSFVIPNENIEHDKKINDFLFPIEQLEALSGLVFFEELRKMNQEIVNLQIPRKKKNEEVCVDSKSRRETEI